MLIIIFITTLLYSESFAPPSNNAEQLYEDLIEKSLEGFYKLQLVQKLMYTVKVKESRGNYYAVGANGEIGAYQFMNSTYNSLCSIYFKQHREPTPHNQDTLAFCSIKNVVINKGYTVEQFAAYWNSGNPNSRKSGINKAGVPFDVGAYVKDFVRRFEKVEKNWPDWSNHYNLFLYTRSGTLLKKQAQKG